MNSTTAKDTISSVKNFEAAFESFKADFAKDLTKHLKGTDAAGRRLRNQLMALSHFCSEARKSIQETRKERSLLKGGSDSAKASDSDDSDTKSDTKSDVKSDTKPKSKSKKKKKSKK